MPGEEPRFGRLAQDPLSSIFQFLATGDFFTAAQVNKHWNAIAKIHNSLFEKAFKKRFPKIYPFIKQRGQPIRDWRQLYWVDKFARYQPIKFLRLRWDLGTQQNWKKFLESHESDLFKGENKALFTALAEDDFPGFSEALHAKAGNSTFHFQDLILRDFAAEKGYFLLLSKGKAAKKYAEEIWEFMQGHLNADLNLLFILAIITSQPIEKIKAYIEAGADVNYQFARNKLPETDKESVLSLSCGQGNLALTRLLVESGANVVNINRYHDAFILGFSTIYNAVLLGHHTLFKYLDRNSATLVKDYYYYLESSCIHGHLALAKQLCKKIDFSTHFAAKELFEAINHGHRKLADFIIAEQLRKGDKKSRLACILLVICRAGSLDLLKEFLKKNKPDLNAIVRFEVPADLTYEQLLRAVPAPRLRCEDRAETALEVASAEGHLEIVKFLIDHGAVFKISETGDNLAMFWAAWCGRSAVMEFLLERGATLSADGLQRCFLRACENGYVSVAQILLEQDPSLINREYQKTGLPRGLAFSSFGIACIYGNKGVAEFLFEKMSPEKKASLNLWIVKNSPIKQETNDLSEEIKISLPFVTPHRDYLLQALRGELKLNPFHLAILFDSRKIVAFLIHLGFDVNQRTRIGDVEDETGLHLASSADMIRLLLAHQADPNISSFKGLTPLHKALCKGELERARLLLENGARLNTFSQDKETPLFFINFFSSDSARKNAIFFLEKSVEQMPKIFCADEILSWKQFWSYAAGQYLPMADLARENPDLLLLIAILTEQNPEEVLRIAHLGASLAETEKYKIDPIELADIFNPSAALELRIFQTKREAELSAPVLSKNELAFFYSDLADDPFEEDSNNGAGYDSQSKRPRSP